MSVSDKHLHDVSDKFGDDAAKMSVSEYSLHEGMRAASEVSADPETGRNSAPGHAHACEAPAWTLEPHICRACFGRVASRPGDAPGYRVYSCTNCGIEASAPKVSALCCCGTTLRKATPSGRSGNVLADAGIRCHLNPEPTPDFPSIYVASEMTK